MFGLGKPGLLFIWSCICSQAVSSILMVESSPIIIITLLFFLICTFLITNDAEHIFLLSGHFDIFIL